MYIYLYMYMYKYTCMQKYIDTYLYMGTHTQHQIVVAFNIH